MHKILSCIAATLIAAFGVFQQTQASPELEPLTIPDVAKAPPRLVTIDDLARLRRIDAFALSPDRQRFAIFVRQADPVANDYRTGWFVGSVKGGALTRVGHGGRAGLRVAPNGRTTGPIESHDIRWSPDGQWIAYTLRRDGEVQLWRSKYDGSVQEQVSHNAADVRAFAWSDDGRTLYLSVGTQRAELRAQEAEKERRGYQFDTDLYFFTEFMFPQHVRPLETQLTVWRVTLSDGDERIGDDADRAAFESAKKRDTGGREVQFGAVTDATIPPVVRADGAQVWLKRVSAGSFTLQVVAAFPSKPDTPVPCEAPECSGMIKKVWWSEDGKRVLFWRGEGLGDNAHGVYAWSPSTGSLRTVFRTLDDYFENCEPAAGNTLICTRSTPTHPTHIASIDLRSGAVRVIAEINPEFRNIRLGKVERFEWDTPKLAWNEPGGRLAGMYPARAYGYIMYPPDFEPGKKYPVFIEPYGAFGFDLPSLHAEQPLHVYAASGFVVLNANFPVDSVWQERMQNLGVSAMKQIYAPDLDYPHLTMYMESTVRALDVAAARGFIDERRVGIGGVSHGSFVPGYMIQKHDRIAAMSASSPPSWAPMEYYVSTRAARKMYGITPESDWMGNPSTPEGAKFWHRIDLADHLDTIEAPILMNLPAHETYDVVRLVRELDAANRAYDIYVYPNEAHIKWKPAHLHSAMTRNLDWFRFWLQDAEDPDPAKSEQYQRWRKLREQHKAYLETRTGKRGE